VVRFLWFAVFVLGLVTAWCAQLSDTTQRMAVYQISLVVDCPDANPNAVPVRDANSALESSLFMSNVTLYLGLAIVLLAGTGLSRPGSPPTPQEIPS
jgi:hypothetical protein